MEWISVEDSLPENSNPVLIFNGAEMAHAEVINGIWFLMNTYPPIRIDKGLPTHWSIMPEPPKEK